MGSVKRCSHFLPKPGSLELNARLTPRAQQFHSKVSAQGRRKEMATLTGMKCCEQAPAHSNPTWKQAGNRDELRGARGARLDPWLPLVHFAGSLSACSFRAARLFCFRFASAERGVWSRSFRWDVCEASSCISNVNAGPCFPRVCYFPFLWTDLFHISEGGCFLGAGGLGLVGSVFVWLFCFCHAARPAGL